MWVKGTENTIPGGRIKRPKIQIEYLHAINLFNKFSIKNQSAIGNDGKSLETESKEK